MPLTKDDPQVRALMDKCRTAHKVGQDLRDLAVKEDRPLTTDEIETCKRAFKEAREFKNQADVLVEGNSLKSHLSDPLAQRPAGDGAPAGEAREGTKAAAEWVRKYIAEPAEVDPELHRAEHLRKARNAIPKAAQMALFKGYLQYGPNEFANRLTPEGRKALASLIDPDGGYVIREESSDRTIERVRDQAEVINAVERIRITGHSISFPNFEYTGSPDAVAEAGTVQTQNWSDIVGKTMFVPVARAKHWKIPRDWLEDSGFNMEARLEQWFSILFVEDMEDQVLNGTGKKGPLGLYQASLNTFETTNATLVLTPEDIKKTPRQLKKQYRRGASWILTRAVLEQIDLFRDASGGAGTGQWMWQMNLVAGEPDRLVGYPYLESEYAPAFADAAGSPAAMFGDLTWYWLVLRRDITVQRLVELHALSREIGIVMDLRYDGAPVLKDPFIKMVRKT